jgi:hypothetical protein
MITSRRSFLVGFGALIAAPAIVRATNIMPVRQMLILPDKLGDITFEISGYARSSLSQADFLLAKWSDEEQKIVPLDATDRWERLKKREHERIISVEV